MFYNIALFLHLPHLSSKESYHLKSINPYSTMDGFYLMMWLIYGFVSWALDIMISLVLCLLHNYYLETLYVLSQHQLYKNIFIHCHSKTANRGLFVIIHVSCSIHIYIVFPFCKDPIRM